MLATSLSGTQHRLDNALIIQKFVLEQIHSELTVLAEQYSN